MYSVPLGGSANSYQFLQLVSGPGKGDACDRGRGLSAHGGRAVRSHQEIPDGTVGVSIGAPMVR